jgi:hypothetical protein
VTPQHIHIHTDLGALLGQLQHVLQRTISVAALGLNAVPRLIQEDLELPGTSISLQLTGPALWPIAEAKEGFEQLSLSRFMVYDASKARRPRAGWWTVHRPAVLLARVPGFHQCDCGEVAAPRSIL